LCYYCVCLKKKGIAHQEKISTPKPIHLGAVTQGPVLQLKRIEVAVMSLTLFATSPIHIPMDLLKCYWQDVKAKV
jgi:hypothetical protein